MTDIWTLGRIIDTKSGTDVSNKLFLLLRENHQGKGEVKLPPAPYHLPRLRLKTHILSIKKVWASSFRLAKITTATNNGWLIEIVGKTKREHEYFETSKSPQRQTWFLLFRYHSSRFLKEMKELSKLYLNFIFLWNLGMMLLISVAIHFWKNP